MPPDLDELADPGDRIASVIAYQFTLPLENPVRNGTTLISDREYVVTEVSTIAGTVGRAVGFTRGAPLATIIESVIAPYAIGLNASAGRALARTLAPNAERFWGTRGMFPRALSLVDIAMWDAWGSQVGWSISDLVGGSGEQTEVLVALGYYRDGKTLDMLAAEYAEMAQRGHRKFKMMVGGDTPANDAQRVRVALDALPHDAKLSIDANGKWVDAREALSFLEMLPFVPDFVEDPFVPGDSLSLRRLRRSYSGRIAIGEWESDAASFRRLVDEDLLDVARIDATACGGITGWIDAAAIVKSAGKAILPHYFPEIHVHLAGPFGAEALETVPVQTGADNFDQLVVKAPWEMEPVTAAATAPGLGILWDEKIFPRNHPPVSAHA
ncbi:enolase C-terminal domain-like protein [Microbacterium thalassium]|uniref:enolase C-terminal domain-like protein n=1 Tax=Microbacterium TaxID=33882 RepID=UPI00146DDD03|nr:enolase C-terminal domain-like protein [Microbacterium thalassium]